MMLLVNPKPFHHTITMASTNRAYYHIYVYGAQKNGQGAVGGFITEREPGKISIIWSISFGICPSKTYAEARAIYKRNSQM